jgi:glycosyltransferase involved in cell wall biosynthesis
MEGLTKRGHECRVVAPEIFMPDYEVYFHEMLRNGEFELIEDSSKLTCIRKKGVLAYSVKGDFTIYSFLKRMIDEFKPDITIVTEDKSHLLIESVLETKTRCIYLSHSQTVLPFGPECFEANEERTRLYHKFHGILSVSEYLSGYFRKWAGLESKTIYFPSYGEGPFPFLGSFDNPYVTAINPSALKGLPIIIGLAKSFPDVKFAAVITWATTNEELEELKKVENITIMQPEADVNNIYKLTKVFLMPSLWGEAFGQVVVEAMLRGIPVISSNVGGLIEAKQGLDYILPVNPIKEYISQKELLVSVHSPVVPEQNLEPWINALSHLLNDREQYESLSRISREKATEFYSKLGFDAFEEYFKEIIEKDGISEIDRKESVTDQDKVLERISMLTPEKREKLFELYRLKGGKV